MNAETTGIAVEIGRKYERTVVDRTMELTHYSFYCGRKPDGELSLSQYEHEAVLMTESVAADLITLLKIRHPLTRTTTLLKGYSTRMVAETMQELQEVNPHDPLIQEFQRMVIKLSQNYSWGQLIAFFGGICGNEEKK
jgi:hypothetical protein